MYHFKLYKSLLCILIAQQAYAQNSFEKLGIEDSFKGFAWQYDTERSEKEVRAKAVIDSDLERELKGIEFVFSKPAGNLISINPVFKKPTGDKFNALMWATNSFRNGSISFECLWEIFRSSIDKSTNNQQLFRVILNSLGDTKKYSTIEIGKNSIIYDVISDIGKQKFVNDGKLSLLAMCQSF